MGTAKRILVAPLDWGLGHAGRCVPVIRTLLSQGAAVVMAGSGRSGLLLRKAFPSLPFEELPAYGIRYPTRSMIANMTWQGPRLLGAVFAEHRALASIIARHGIQGVVSDSRFGCFSRQVPCVFLTHQLHIQAPYLWLGAMINAVNHRIIAQFQECWVPDFAGEPSLSGALGHPPLWPGPTHYVGPLSQLPAVPGARPGNRIAVILSGPEPQRSRLERILLEQARERPESFVVVGGRPEDSQAGTRAGNVEYIPFLEAEALALLLASARLIISRPGYSTIMDLAVAGRPAILIPTPGQTEQLYLAEHFSGRGIFCARQQHGFDLAEALAAAPQYPGLPRSENSTAALDGVVADWLARIPADGGRYRKRGR